MSIESSSYDVESSLVNLIDNAVDTSKKDGSQSSASVKNSYASELESTALQQMVYDSNYTEDINVKMRIPEKLTVAQDRDAFPTSAYGQNRRYDGTSAYTMEVPERIVVSVSEDGVRYGGTDEIQDPLYVEDYEKGKLSEFVSLTTPPRKLTLAERNLDTLDIPESQRIDETAEVVTTTGLRADESSLSSTMIDNLVPPTHDDSLQEVDDITVLRRQVFKLHRRITSIEKRQAEKSKRDFYIYAFGAAILIINSWFLYGSRKPY